MKSDDPNRPVPELTANLGRVTLFLLMLTGAIAAIELGWQVQGYVRNRGAVEALPPAAYLAAYPGREADLREYYRSELATGWAPTRYVPFVEWRRAQFASRFVNVDPDGVRRTCFNSGDTAAKQVWVFGGSTVWGTGAPDCETLPSHLSRLLNMSGPHVVTNFGEGAYVSTQALIRFQVLLRSGDRPDVAVFYGGYNDIWTTVYVHAGTHQEEPRIRAILEASHLKRAAMGLRKAFDGESLMFGYFLRLFDNRTEKPEDSWLRPAAVGPAEIAKALDMYFENTKITKAIADTYGIALHTYWQPNVVDKMPVSDVEAVRVESLPPELVSALRLAARIVDRGSQGVENLRRVFDGDSRTLFVDYAHLSSDGNRVVANRIASDIQAGAAAQR